MSRTTVTARVGFSIELDRGVYSVYVCVESPRERMDTVLCVGLFTILWELRIWIQIRLSNFSTPNDICFNSPEDGRVLANARLL